MRFPGKTGAVLLLFFSTVRGVEGASFTIEEWALGTVAEEVSGPSDVDFSTVVQNPFRDSHFASIGIVTAATTFDFAWGTAGGDFLLQGTHQVQDTDGIFLEGGSSGNIFVLPTIDLRFTVEADYTYNLPAPLMAASLFVAASKADPFETIFSESESASTVIVGSADGTLSIQGEGVLPAGEVSVLTYRMRIFTTGAAGALATGSGNVAFHLEPVPEPATASMLLVGGSFIFRRHPRRR